MNTLAIIAGLIGVLVVAILLYGRAKGEAADAKSYKAQADGALDAKEREERIGAVARDRRNLAARLRARRDRRRG